MRIGWWPGSVKNPQTVASISCLRLFHKLNAVSKISQYEFYRGIERLTDNTGNLKMPVSHWRQWVLPFVNFIAQDANFRLANAMRSSEARNPVLGDGWGYFVGRASYMDYVRSFANEEDISTCSGFAAVFLANLKRVRGLRATGAHSFCNMTYVLASALAHEQVQHIVYSYDVACVFDKNLRERISTLPDHLQQRIADLVFSFFVPNFHLPAHRAPCHAPYSFHFAPGVGRTHGETVEENWFIMNKAAAQTKPMGPGTRQLTLEDHAGCHDHESSVSLGRLLPRRLVRTIQSFMSSYDEYEQLRDGIEKRNPALVAEWIALEKKWQEDRSSTTCPYEHATQVQNLKDAELVLQQQEMQRTPDGTAVVQEVTVTAFIKLGIDIQHAQRLLVIDLKAAGPQPTSTQQLDVLKKRAKLRKSIDKFRSWQRIYMPSLADHLSHNDLNTYGKVIDETEHMRLFLPSELSDAARNSACAPGVVTTETTLRAAEAEQSLEDLRRALRIKTATNQFRQANVRHISMATRAHTAFDKIAKRVHIAKMRYRFARNCLVHLRGPGEWERQLRPLNDEDIRALNERALTAEERAERERARALGHDVDWAASDGVVLEGVVNAGEGSRRLSWIWYMDPGQAAITDHNLNDALRVEFLKSKARRDRDREEIQLLLEEMRRTIASLDYDSEQWSERAGLRQGCDDALADGLRSYAMEQAAWRSERAALLEMKWKPVQDAARLALDLHFDNLGQLTDEDAAQELQDTLDGVDKDDTEDFGEDVDI
uniref:CxC2-like cysteine cluster KDZ transposase-associated domain-containing protein n=1 Tax=Schizophyllum commune (strain H4-8 / FGSC 9210) TaxID=578458 RepID=D8QJP9_SCHCM